MNTKRIIAMSLLISGSSPAFSGYVIDRWGQPVRDGFGECVQASSDNVLLECLSESQRKALVKTTIIKQTISKPYKEQYRPKVPIHMEQKVAHQPLSNQDKTVLESQNSQRTSPKNTSKSKMKKIGIQQELFFELNAFSLNKVNTQKIDSMLKTVEQAKIKSIQVDGYADSSGTKQYNKALSTKRAEVVKSYIETRLNQNLNIHAHGHSETTQFSGNNPSLNRRVMINLNAVEVVK